MMSSQKNNNKKSIDHLLFEKNPIFAFFHEEVSMTYNSVYTQVHTARTHIYIRVYTVKQKLGYTDTNRIDSDMQTVNGMEKEKLYIFLLHQFIIIKFIHSFLHDNDV